MLIYHKKKFHNLYKQIAEAASKQSYCIRRKVGACIVTIEGLTAIGFNGTAPGQPNMCELPGGTTDPNTIHAEVNALDKLTRQGVSTEGAILFVTTAPCMECAKSLASAGIKKVYYRDIQSNIDGLNFLVKAGVDTEQYT